MPLEARFIQVLHSLRDHVRGILHHTHENHHQLHEIYQSSTINAIIQGIYDGQTTYGELKNHGDFGLGTFNGLDGEMIADQGKFYQIKVDGQAYPVSDDMKTPFAILLPFTPDQEHHVSSMNYDQMQQQVDQLSETPNAFYAIRLEGRFLHVKTRSIAKQQKPYKPFVDVVKEQQISQWDEVDGVLVGFRFPDFTGGINVPGYHCHFLTADHQHGGHVLSFELASGKLQIDHTSEFHLDLPTAGAFLQTDIGSDFSKEIHQTESDPQ